MKHTKTVTLAEAMERGELTQQQVEDASGVDRTWIAKLLTADHPNPTITTYNKLQDGLRKLRVLKPYERLTFSASETAAR